MGKVHKPGDYERCKPSSEPFRIYRKTLLFKDMLQ
jgi:hypothetical protein